MSLVGPSFSPSVRRSVGRSVRPSVRPAFDFFAVFGLFTAPAQPHATSLACIRPFFSFSFSFCRLYVDLDLVYITIFLSPLLFIFYQLEIDGLMYSSVTILIVQVFNAHMKQ